MPIPTTTTIARTGSPTSPGPWPALRGSPPAAELGVGDAASAAAAVASQARTARESAPPCGRG